MSKGRIVYSTQPFGGVQEEVVSVLGDWVWVADGERIVICSSLAEAAVTAVSGTDVGCGLALAIAVATAGSIWGVVFSAVGAGGVASCGPGSG